MSWRWDQGRLNYFQYDEIKKIAQALSDYDGRVLPVNGSLDDLRVILGTQSDLPFAPSTYTVWRNYGRVFGCQLLAAKVGNQMVCTELCKYLALNECDVDEYLHHVVTRFYYPSPIFDNYNVASPVTFPFLSIIKYLISQSMAGINPSINVDMVADLLIGNNITGMEPVRHYLTLTNTGHVEPDTVKRQIRELMAFVSQFSFLKWINQTLYLDVASIDESIKLEKLMHHVIPSRKTDKGLEIIDLGSRIVSSNIVDITSKALINSALDQEFTEGGKKPVTHLRSERSKKLRELYFATITLSQMCDMCQMDTHSRYSWTDHLIELHHLLPLSSPIRAEKSSTSLKDLVGLCPSCHRATHRYYSKWLKTNSLKDFRDYTESKAVYGFAKSAIVV